MFVDKTNCDRTTSINDAMGSQGATLPLRIEVAHYCLLRLVWPAIEFRQ
jgi:hypothetical protein